ncbi:MAG: L,D-transpeptidase family protein [Cyclobacteriaceae bacterium]|nr:L,D-transpeptidase family protein [Cyclobacteriaceae bacterium]
MDKKFFIGIAAFLVLGFGIFWLFSSRTSDLSEELEQSLEKNIPGYLVESRFAEDIREFYQEREYQEVWFNGKRLSSSGKELLNQLETIAFEGLQPEDYHWQDFQFMVSGEKTELGKIKKLNEVELASLELLMTHAFFTLSKDLEFGKVDPQSLDANWKFEEKEGEYVYADLLREVADGASVEETLEKLNPELQLYANGRKAIRDLYELKEKDTLDWSHITLSEALKVGESHPKVPKLRERLIFWGFLSPYTVDRPLTFDSKMEAGLKEYQKSQGMEPDGVIGSLVVSQLNKSPNDLIDLAAANMERLRWLPSIDWDQEMVLVNVANFQLDYLKKSDTLFTTKVIVGKDYSESPSFTAPMSYIVFSPYWNIPPSITHEEIIPAIKKNKSYLEQKNMELVDQSGELVNSSSVKWEQVDTGEFPYRIRQKPGGSNSLGLVKFMFPNPYNIYIHDTPNRNLFAKESRALSHGCIRIQYPDQFAKVLLGDSEWTDEKIQEAMNQQNEQSVKLEKSISVVLLYLTFWSEENGGINYRQDIYGRDEALIRALKSSKSSPDQA